jgi:hypothetical protein
MSALDLLHGKTIERIDDEGTNEFLVVYFIDGTKWLLLAERWECARARVRHHLAFAHRKTSSVSWETPIPLDQQTPIPPDQQTPAALQEQPIAQP